MECEFVKQYDGTWMCANCLWHYDKKTKKPPRRNCPEATDTDRIKRNKNCGCNGTDTDTRR